MIHFSLQACVVLAAVLFAIGFLGVLLRRNTLVIYMCLELMLVAATLALVAFSRFTGAAIAIIAVILAVHGERFPNAGHPVASLEWLRLGNFSVTLGFKYDDLAALMLCIVGIVGLCVHVFSLGYMHDDAAKARYFG